MVQTTNQPGLGSEDGGATPPEGQGPPDDLDRPGLALRLTWAEMAAQVQAGRLSEAQARALWRAWATPDAGLRLPAPTLGREAPRFSFGHTLYYFGGLMAIGAMTLFMTLGWELFGPWGVLALALGYGVGALRVTRHLMRQRLYVPAGILATLALCLVPLAVWALQHGLGWWPEGSVEHYRDYHRWIDWRWLWLELATLAAAAALLARLRLPFLVMPLAVTLWYLSMDLTHMLMQKDGFDWTFSRNMSLVFGLGTCALAVWVDLRTRLATQAAWRQDFAFWLYLFGALMFWGGLTLQDSGSEWGKLGYAAINVGLVFLGAAVNRRVFTVLGAVGVSLYLGHLAWRVFADSLLFPFVLSLLGLAVVALGIVWQRREAELQARLLACLPPAWRRLAQPAPW